MTSPSAGVLLTGFEPFAGADVNESWEAVLAAQALLVDPADGTAAHPAIPGRAHAPCEIAVRRLPVVFGRAADELLAAVRFLRPALVVACGLAAGRTAVTPERIAVNVQDARIPDGSGARPCDEPCVAGAPDGLFSTLPVKAMVLAAREMSIPAEVSASAGTYVCNDVFYRLQHALRTETALRGIRGGFVHVPGGGQLPAAESGRALAAMIERALVTPGDVRAPGGSES